MRLTVCLPFVLATICLALAPQVQAAGSLSLTKLLRVRFLRTLKLLEALEAEQPDPPVFGTDGLSDGPDPIDGGGQAGDTPPTDKSDHDQGGSGNDQTDPSSFDSD